jgi:hypothetical protein
VLRGLEGVEWVGMGKWGMGTFPVWLGRCVEVKVGGGMKKDWSQKDESFWPMAMSL